MASTSGLMCNTDNNLWYRNERDDSELLPKHTIFLSHSGAQKPFVEQLYEDLINRGQSPFFDQSPESLPKGELFAELIFEAAKNFKVAVVVLSREYLSSKWTMLELVAFVEAQRTCNANLKILPLFYKLEVGNLIETQAMKAWIAEWEDMVVVDPRINVDKFKDATRSLAGANGEVFSKFGGSEVRYRKAIVESVCKLCRLYVERNLASIVGQHRLCNVVMEIHEHKQASVGPSKVGLHGLGGMGKTTICKALCNSYYGEYSGRTCFAEYSRNGCQFHLQKYILEELTDVNKDWVRTINDMHQVDQLLKQHLPRHDEFLALDNVQDDDSYLSPKSKVVVTSRSYVNVRRVLGRNVLLLCAPTLMETKVLELFKQSAGCTKPLQGLTWQEHNNLIKCINQCFYGGSCQKRKHYNPLVLKELGNSIIEYDTIEPKRFVEKCMVMGTIYDILRKSFCF